MRYAVRHRTTFEYEQLVSVSHHVLHLAPRAHAQQTCRRHTLDVAPAPSLLTAGTDYFGNPTHYLTISEPHRQLVIEAHAEVDVAPLDVAVEPGADEPWEAVRSRLVEPAGDAIAASEFSYESPYIQLDAELNAYAAGSFTAGRPLLAAALDLTRRIYEDFEYQGGVSDVSTPVADVLAMRKGVCQDFAHVGIGCLRSLGLAARYVSGYLLTRAPAGRPKLIGADASHAWLAVWSSRLGWVDLDPTNNLIPSVEHVTLGWGRDYGDVSPINGFIIGGGAHEVDVAVDVVPLEIATA